MPEVPEGWTATTPPAESAPYSTSSLSGSLWPWRVGEMTDLVNRTSLSPRSFIDIFLQHLAAKAGNIHQVIRLCGSLIDVNSTCPVGMTPLDLAVNPRVRDYLFRHGGRITRAGIYGQRVLCDVQETFDQFKDIDEGFSPFTPFMKEFSTDEVDSASVSMMQIDRQKSRLPDSSKNTIVAADFSNSPIPWEKSIPAIVHGDPRESPFTNFSKITGGAIDASYSPVFLQEPTRAPIYENIEGLKFAKSSRKKEGAADLSGSPMSWQNTTEAPTPEKGSQYPMSRYLGSSAGSAAISIRGSSYRSSYQNPSLRQTSLLRTAMLSKGSQGQHKLMKEDWEQHVSWATPPIPTPKW